MDRQKTILLIEDEGLLSQMYSKKFEADGYKCISAGTGKSGLDEALKAQPDIIVCDVMMPEMDGLSLLAKLKESLVTKDIPVIVLSNVSDQDYINQAMELGARAYLIKNNLLPADVVRKIKEILGD